MFHAVSPVHGFKEQENRVAARRTWSTRFQPTDPATPHHSGEEPRSEPGTFRKARGAQKSASEFSGRCGEHRIRLQNFPEGAGSTEIGFRIFREARGAQKSVSEFSGRGGEHRNRLQNFPEGAGSTEIGFRIFRKAGGAQESVSEFSGRRGEHRNRSQNFPEGAGSTEIGFRIFRNSVAVFLRRYTHRVAMAWLRLGRPWRRWR